MIKGNSARVKTEFGLMSELESRSSAIAHSPTEYRIQVPSVALTPSQTARAAYALHTPMRKLVVPPRNQNQQAQTRTTTQKGIHRRINRD
ncbi:hypothetical protein [Pseudotabrizicola sp.]|uniref:hypothetical protein n=1 Tax=Pseudotabrizicola sp. TaxID=2939647 RepID=UPI00272B15FB|nr:hypothetical protein [Pseudotabrizicola sp.]